MTTKLNGYLTALVEAALDQPNPTPELKAALNEVLTLSRHKARDLSRDVKRRTDA